jgi:tRNA 5-methylaminomethyl-2-thiouridine biosynthesis bifunctional protein
MSRYQPLGPARIDWDETAPRSRDYGDIYFSTAGAIDETHHVFLQGNDLPQRWQACPRFCIGETGFGTGLNFLCTLNEWLQSAPPGARLDYLSVEKHPLTRTDLQRALSAWPTLKALATELLEHYPPLAHGMHQRQLLNGRVTLTLLFGDAAEMLADIESRQVDAWYLDGFAPSRNPDMWNHALFAQIARLSRIEATCATFTAAGIVRRGLQQAGFSMEIRPGHGRKRDMLTGRLSEAAPTQSQQPWFQSPNTELNEKQAVVIGAGLAGCTTAHSLARRGWKITLIERHANIAQEASGNHAGVVMPRLTADMSTAGRFYLSAFLHTTHWLNQLKQRDPALPWFQSGVLQLCDERQQSRMQKLGLPEEVLQICDREIAGHHCGMTTRNGGLFFPGGGWLEPPTLCRWLLDDQRDNITRLTEYTALSLNHEQGKWQVSGADGTIASAESIIITNGYDAERLLGTDIFKLQKVRGQIAYLAATAETRKLKTPVCYDGYIIPDYKGLHCAGATYDPGNDSSELKRESEQEILDTLAQELPAFEACSAQGGRVAFRTSTQDHMPIIGPVPDAGFYTTHYGDLHHGRPAHRYPTAEYLSNLFISTGHGSRGLVTCPLAAEMIGDLLDDSINRVESDLSHSCHPARYIIQQLKRRDSR